MTEAKAAVELVVPDVRKRSGSWGHACGRIWGREAHLFGRGGLDRLYGAETVDDVRRLLLEHQYPQEDTVAQSVAAEHRDTYALIDDIMPDDVYMLALLLPADGHNIKVCLKQSLREGDRPIEDVAAMFRHPARLEAASLHAYIVEGERDTDLEPWAIAVIARAREAYKEAYDVASIDRSVDRDIHELLRRLAADAKAPWLAEVLATERDLINLETLLRGRHRKVSAAVYEATLLPEGKLSHTDWAELFSADRATLTLRLRETPYAPLVDHIETYGQRGGPSLFARDRDRLLMDAYARGTRVFTGPERVVAYVKARACEFKNIRIVMAGLVDGIEHETILSLRRDFGS
jgi:vacuolar-type H+-ATPase subunit C/Vma6